MLNHTANESPWLRQHPESTFNLINSPHFRPAYLLDRLLWYLAEDIGKGKYVGKGIPTSITSEDHIQAVGRLLRDELVPALRLHEFYLAHVDDLVASFVRRMDDHLSPDDMPKSSSDAPLKLIQDPQYRRLKSTVDWDVAFNLFNAPRSLKTLCFLEPKLNSLI